MYDIFIFVRFLEVDFTHLFYHSGKQETPLYLHSLFQPSCHPPTFEACPFLPAVPAGLSHHTVSLSHGHVTSEQAAVAAAHVGTTDHPQDTQAQWGQRTQPWE